MWFGPTHVHILFVGWFLQFAVGIALWLLPRRGSPELPLGYGEDAAFVAFVLLNGGLMLRVAAEPIGRTESDGWAVAWTFAVVALAQLGAIAILARQLWRRVIPRRATRRTDAGE